MNGEIGKWYWIAHDDVFTPVFIISKKLVMLGGEEICRKEFESESLQLIEAVMPTKTRLQ